MAKSLIGAVNLFYISTYASKKAEESEQALFKCQGGRESGKGRQVRGVRGGRSLLTDGEGR